MNKFLYQACGNCTHMQIIKNRITRDYYCPLVDGIIPNGKVHPTMCAQKCIEEKRYKIKEQRNFKL